MEFLLLATKSILPKLAGLCLEPENAFLFSASQKMEPQRARQALFDGEDRTVSDRETKNRPKSKRPQERQKQESWSQGFHVQYRQDWGKCRSRANEEDRVMVVSVSV